MVIDNILNKLESEIHKSELALSSFYDNDDLVGHLLGLVQNVVVECFLHEFLVGDRLLSCKKLAVVGESLKPRIRFVNANQLLKERLLSLGIGDDLVAVRTTFKVHVEVKTHLRRCFS